MVGTFSGRPQGSLFNLSNIPFIISYTGGFGNDVTLTVTNLALRGAGVGVASGNGNGIVDANECNLLFIGLENPTASAISGITARLDTTTLGAIITQQDSAYPTTPALGFGTNSTAFQLRTLCYL